jgi:hypothetical protein
MIGRTSDRDTVMRGDPGYNAMRFCRALNVVSGAVAIALLALPWPSLLLLALVAIMPIVAVAAAFASGSEITLGGRAGTTDTRPTAVWALWLPSLALALHAYWDGMNLLAPNDALWAGAIGGVILLIVVLLADPIVRYSVPRALPLAVPAFLYAAGMAGPVDVLADMSAPLVATTAQVIARGTVAGHAGAYELQLSAWGPVAGVNHARVSREVYDRAVVGAEVCVSLHAGALAMKWYRVEACQ